MRMNALSLRVFTGLLTVVEFRVFSWAAKNQTETPVRRKSSLSLSFFSSCRLEQIMRGMN